jgi:DNA-binding MarR family transcriptional regulator
MASRANQVSTKIIDAVSHLDAEFSVAFRIILKAFPKLDLTPLHVSVLELLSVKEATMSEIADELLLKLPSATLVVDKLFEKNLVTRLSLKNDRRTTLIRLSNRGINLIHDLHIAKSNVAMQCLSMLTDLEREQLLNLHTKIVLRSQKNKK